MITRSQSLNQQLQQPPQYQILTRSTAKQQAQEQVQQAQVQPQQPVQQPQVQQQIKENKPVKFNPNHYEFLSQEFVDNMYDNMWKYMNPDVIKNIFKNGGVKIKLSFKPVLQDYNYKQKKFHNSICFKGDADNGGHYNYVDKKGEDFGTYEDDIISDKDDGMCHGAAMYYAWKDKRGKMHKFKNPAENVADLVNNYTRILKFYHKILKNKWFEQSVAQEFNVPPKKLKTNVKVSEKLI